MQFCECFTGFIESHEVLNIIDDGDTRERFLQVCGKTLTILRRVEYAVDIIEDVLFGNRFGIAEAPTDFF